MSFNSDTDDETRAEQVLTVRDWRRMDAAGLSAAEYLRREHDIEPADHDSEDSLSAAVLSARKLNGDSDHKSTDTDDGQQVSASVGVDSRTYGDSEVSIEALSQSVMTVSDWREADRTDTSPREYVAEEHGVDPAGYRDEAALRRAIAEADR